jgi:hypothetical protein
MAELGQLLMMLLLGGLMPSDTDPLPPEQVMLHMPGDCEVMAFEDLRGIGDAIDGLMTDLSTQAWIITNEELREGFQEASQGFTQMEALAVEVLGINPFDDLTAVSFCMKMGADPAGMPDYLVVLQGNFDSTLADRLGAEAFDPVVLSNGASVYGTNEGGTIVGLAVPRPGVLVFGSEHYLTPVAAASAPPPILPTPGSMLELVSELAPYGIRSFVGVAPSAAFRALLASEAPVSIAELVTGIERAMWATGDRTDLIELRATGADSHRDYELILSGIGAMAEASPLVMRGMAHLFLGVLSPSDPDLDEGLRSLASHREDILTLLESSGLLAETEVELTSDASTFTTSLTMTNTEGASGAAMIMMFGGFMTGIMFLGDSARPPDYESYDATTGAGSYPVTPTTTEAPSYPGD